MRKIKIVGTRRSLKKFKSNLHGPEELESRNMMTASVPISILPPEPINGVGNNIANPTWGSTNSDFTRRAAGALRRWHFISQWPNPAVGPRDFQLDRQSGRQWRRAGPE